MSTVNSSEGNHCSVPCQGDSEAVISVVNSPGDGGASSDRGCGHIQVSVPGRTDPSAATSSGPSAGVSEPGGCATDGAPPPFRRARSSRYARLMSVHTQLKDLKGQYGQWTCFLCCHVRTGAIVIGFWQLLLHLMALYLIAVIIVHPEVLNRSGLEAGLQGTRVQLDVQAVNCSDDPCLLAAQGDLGLGVVSHDYPLVIGYLLSTHHFNTEDVNAALFITLCTFMVTLLMLYGTIKGRASHLMPFFFLQVFDFSVYSLTIIGYLSYLPNIRRLVQQTPTFPFQRELLEMNTKCLTFFVMLLFISSCMVKAYSISIVWRCYKFLMQRSQPGRVSVCSRRGACMPVDQESQTLVMEHYYPDVQFRKKSSLVFPEPPPSYDMAMAASNAQQEILNQVQAGFVSQDSNCQNGNTREGGIPLLFTQLSYDSTDNGSDVAPPATECGYIPDTFSIPPPSYVRSVGEAELQVNENGPGPSGGRNNNN